MLEGQGGVTEEIGSLAGSILVDLDYPGIGKVSWKLRDTCLWG